MGLFWRGGRIHPKVLTPENNYLPDYSQIPSSVLKRAKIMFLCYPNNPTAAVVDDPAFFKETVKFAQKNDILVVYDNPYCEITFDGYVAPSFLSTPGAEDVALEFHSFSKTYNMAGWRIGWVCGKKSLLAPLEKYKAFVDYGVPTFMQLAAVAALEGPQDCVKEMVATYLRRRNYFVKSSPKFYFFDNGVKRALAEELTVEVRPQTSQYGYAFEQLVINEIYRLQNYLRKDYRLSYLLTEADVEIDLIIERPGEKRVAIEIKSTIEIRNQDLKNLITLGKDIPNCELFCFSQDPISKLVDGIRCVHWLEGLKEIGL